MVKGYKASNVGTIPEDWDCVCLLDKCQLLNGLTYTPNNVVENGLLVLRASNVQNSELFFDDNVYVDCEVDEEHLIHKNDIVICVRNGSKTLLGKCAISKYDYNATFGAFMAVLRGLDNTFIFQLFQRGNIQKDIIRKSGATINQITNKDFKSLMIPYPPNFEERTLISNALSDIDELIYSLEMLIKKKKAIRKGAIQELITGKKRLPGFDKEWRYFQMSEIGTIVMGQSPDSKYYNDTQGVPLVQGNADIKNRKTIIRFYTTVVTKSASRGDIIFTVRAPVGNVAYATFDCCLGRGVCAIKNSSPFVFHLLVYKQDSWSDLSSGSTFDSINSNTLKKVELYMPTDEKEREAIADVLSEIDFEIESLDNKLEKYHKLKSGMVNELLTGKIRLV